MTVTETTTPVESPVETLPVGAIPTSTVEVEGLGTVGEDKLDSLTKDWLKKVLRALDAVPPRSASADDLRTMARNGLRLRAMQAAADAAGVDVPVDVVDAGDNPDVSSALVAPTEEERGLIPQASQFAQIVAMAEYLAKSNLCPEALRGKPNDVGAVLLRAWDLGISQSAALESLYVIHGKVGMEGKLMAALIRRAGHSLRVVESDEQHAVWFGKRADNGDEGIGEFSLDDALTAGLIDSINADGTVKPLRDKPTWQRYTKAMLKWRALAILARDVFSDAIAGVSYLPEELGYIDVDAADQLGRGGGSNVAAEATMTLNQQRSELAARIADLDDDLRAELREEWKRRGLPKPDDLRPGAVRTARGLIEETEKKQADRKALVDETIDEAEVVEDGGTDTQGGTSEAAGTGTGEGTSREPPPSPAPPAEADEADLVETCEGCGEQIGDNEHPVYDAAEKPWHVECSPDFGGAK